MLPVVPDTDMVMMPPRLGGLGPEMTVSTLFEFAWMVSSTSTQVKDWLPTKLPISGGASYTERVADWAAAMALPLDPARNHYDRFVHLAFGLLLTWPLIELWRPRVVHTPGIAIVLGLLEHSSYFTTANPQLHCDPSFGTKEPLSSPGEMDGPLRSFFAEALPKLERDLGPWRP